MKSCPRNPPESRSRPAACCPNQIVRHCDRPQGRRMSRLLLLSTVAVVLLVEWSEAFCRGSSCRHLTYVQHWSKAVIKPTKAYMSMSITSNMGTAADSMTDVSAEDEEANIDHRIFCNVELNLASLEAVGFDMDFTLAQYNEDFDILAFEGAKKKLVENLGYPPEILQFKYSSAQFRRGLIIDKKRGNILKVDRHKYVKKVFHGLEELTTNTRKAIYRKQVASFTESNYVNIDTIFLLVDAVLFTYLVDFLDKNPGRMKKSYEQLYSDVRQSVDLCHRDGVIKDTVMKCPEKYIIYDENLVPMLKQLKDSGKKVFLLTNSMWEYTTVVMDYLVNSRNKIKGNWQDLFDLVIVGACKPAFLKDDYLSIFKVNPANGNLHNVEDKESLCQGSLLQQKTYQGGCWQDLHRMLNVASGERILYVGDHMYADILRSKRTLGWRTCLIIPELEHELEVARNEGALAKEMYKFRKLQFRLDEQIDLLQWKARSGENVGPQLREAEEKVDPLKKQVQKTTEEYNRKFNRYWGQLFKAGHQDSRFAKQVMDYACLYTSRASNLAFVSPNRPFRPVQDFMPHDQLLAQNGLLSADE